MNRRNLLKTGLTLAGSSLIAPGAIANSLSGNSSIAEAATNAAPGKRKLGGKLEVSSIG